MFGKSKIEIAKFTASAAVQWSTSFTVGAILHAVLPPSTSSAQRVKMIVGSYAIGAMVADQASAYTEKQIDQVTEAIAEIKKTKNDQTDSE